MTAWNIGGTNPNVSKTKTVPGEENEERKKSRVDRQGTEGLQGAVASGAVSGITLEFFGGLGQVDSSLSSASYTAKGNMVSTQPATQMENSVNNAKDTDQTMESNRGRLSEQDASELEEEGFSLEKYDEERLERTLERLMIQHQLKAQAIENQIDDNKAFREDMVKQAIAIAVSHGMSQSVAAKLAMADLPATVENEYRLNEAVKRAEEAVDMTEGMKAFLTGLSSEPTIEQMSQAKYIGESRFGFHTDRTGTQGDSLEESWSQLEEQVKARLSEQGYSITDPVMEDARWLFEHQLPISAKTMDQLFYLNDISNTNWTSEKIAGQVASHMAAGEDALTTVLVGDGIGELAARRRLEETRLEMTLSAAQKMQEAGIEVDTDGMQNRIDQMKQTEQAYYESLLAEADCEIDEDNLSLLQQTVEKTISLQKMPAYLLGETYGQRGEQTIDSLHEAGQAIQYRLDEAGERYETMMTVPRKDLGDSLSKAFAHTDEILSDLGMEQTDANRRAIRILGYNQMEITKESVISMKNYDAKVQSVLKQMQPPVVAELIKRGENPLHTRIEALGQKTADLMEELGVTDEEKYSSFLWKAQQDGTISEDERQAFVGIYRLLNQVEKSDGAALGALVKSGREVTLSNLLSAVRSQKNAGMDVRIDDQFGELKQLTYQSMNITQQIEAYYGDSVEPNAYEGDKENEIPKAQGQNSAAAIGLAETVNEEEMSYVQQVIRDVLDQMTPALLKQAVERGKTQSGEQAWDYLKDLSVEQLEQNLMEGTDSAGLEAAYRYQELEYFRAQTTDCQEAVELLKQYEIPTTFAYVSAAKQMLLDGKAWYQRLNELDEGRFEPDSSDALADCLGEDDMEEVFRKFEENEAEVLRNALENPNNTVEEFEQIRRMGTRILLGQNLREKNFIEIPYSDGGQISLMRIQIRQGTGQSGTIDIRRDSERYGQMSAQLKVQNGQVSGYAFYDTRDGMDAAKKQIEVFKDAVGDMGMEVLEFHHAMAHTDAMNTRSSHWEKEEKQEQKEDLNTLLRVAKVFVRTMKGTQTE
ncbi:MAG: DUF6240 domain-containing protein [Clostridiales bacterium]|nr:DUF6240 domain-containing protein [Clostridiales bacterium]